MRVEGTHQFNAPIERVYAALMNPDALRAALPGCERMIQLGPPDASGQLHGEARVALAPTDAPRTYVWLIEPTRIPQYLKYAARATDATTQIAIAGFVDLVAREGQTVAAYVWDVLGQPVTDGEDQASISAAGASYLKRVGDALAAQFAGDHPRATLDDALPILRADSARGRITLLPAEPAAEPVLTRLRPVLNRGVWAVAGIATGVLLLAGLAATLSHLRKRDAPVTR
jgi:hypothetical protein